MPVSAPTKDSKLGNRKTDVAKGDKPGVSRVSKAGGVQSQRPKQTMQAGKENKMKMSKVCTHVYCTL